MQNGPSNTEAFSAQICTQNVPKSSMADSAPTNWPGKKEGRNILKTSEPIFMQIGTSDPRGKSVKRSTFGSAHVKD